MNVPGVAAPAGPSKNELKKAAKKAEKDRLAAEKAAKAKERQEAQAAAEPVRILPQQIAFLNF